jgi:hypothetical protein
MNKQAAKSSGGRGFDDELAAGAFKLALIERYCREQVSAHEVERIFAETPALKAA